MFWYAFLFFIAVYYIADFVAESRVEQAIEDFRAEMDEGEYWEED